MVEYFQIVALEVSSGSEYFFHLRHVHKAALNDTHL